MRKFYILLLSLFTVTFAFSQTQTETFKVERGGYGGATNQFTFTVPCGVSSITVETWGAGAAGSSNGGGGGGAYAKKVLSVTSGTTYTIVVGRGGGTYGGGFFSNPNYEGENSRFYLVENKDSVRAEGGGQSGTNYINGGRASASVGDIRYSGGNGVNGTGRGGGGGGSSASSIGSGSNGQNSGNNNGGIGGIASLDGGNGGDGGGSTYHSGGWMGGSYWEGEDGSDGSDPGGGGGQAGSGSRNYLNGQNGNGSDGMVKITYNGPAYAQYCDISFDNTLPITYVGFAGISRTNSNGTDSYLHFCDMGYVNRGGTYQITLRGKTQQYQGNNNDYYTVFIDWNGDGVFDNSYNSNERYRIGTITNSSGSDTKVLTGDIKVPDGAKVGTTTMRVIKNGRTFNNGTYINSPCDNKDGSGQVQDYQIFVSGGCQQPAGATANDKTDLKVCADAVNKASVTLKQTGGALSSGQEWKWYIGSPSGTSIGTSTSPDASITTEVGATTTYYVRAEGGDCGTTGTGKTVTVTVSNPATITLTSGQKDFEICDNSGAIAPVVFTWGGGATTASITAGALPTGLGISYDNNNKKLTISGTPTQTGTFNYTVSPSGNDPCTNSTISGTITVVTKLGGLSYSKNPAEYCKGSKIQDNVTTLVSGTATSYSIYPALPAGLSFDTNTGRISGTPTASSSETTYTVTATNSHCDVSTTINISVTDGAGIVSFNVVPAGDHYLCMPGASGIEITINGSENDRNYQLYKDGTAIGNPVSGDVNGGAISFGTFTDPGTYTVATTGDCPTLMNGAVHIYNSTKPNVAFQYDENLTTFCKFQNTTGPAILTGQPQTGKFTAAPISGGTISIDNNTGEVDLTKTDAGTYQVTYTVTASGGCSVYTSSVTITVMASATVFNLFGGGSYCANENAPLVVLSNSTNGVTYNLFKLGDTNPVISRPGDGDSLTFYPTESGSYYVIASVSGACETPMNGTIKITENPVPDPVYIVGTSTPVCLGTVVPLSASMTNSNAQPQTVSFSKTVNANIPDNSASGLESPIVVSGIPSGATIQEISVKFKITGGRAEHLRINLMGPNGNVLNLANRVGPTNGNNRDIFRDSTTISSTAQTSIAASSDNPRNGIYSPHADPGVDGATSLANNTSNVASFNGLYNSSDGMNGTWHFSARDVSYNYTSNLAGWSITITYVMQSQLVNVSWANSPDVNDLYLDAGGEFDPYKFNKIQTNTVYANPASSGDKNYIATLTNQFGCSVSATKTVHFNPGPDLSVEADYCSEVQNNFVVITATSSNIDIAKWQWSGSPDQGPVNKNRTSVIKTKTAGDYFVSATANGCTVTKKMSIATELVTNGNFEGDFTPGQFVTGYTYKSDLYVNGDITSGLWPEGTYTVAANAHDYHSNFWGLDHTTNNGTGKFLIVNGVTNSTTTIWKQTVEVIPNTDYYFSAFAVALNSDGGDNAQANLSFSVNGTVIGNPTGTLPVKPQNNNSNNALWQRFYGHWNSGSATTADIEIVNLTPNAGGNDFGIDDISFGTLSTFFNQTSEDDTKSQVFCSESTMETIQYEYGGTGNPPLITWTLPDNSQTNTTPDGIEAYYNGRDYLLRGLPNSELAGLYHFKLDLEVCKDTVTHIAQHLYKEGDLNIYPQPSPGSFQNSVNGAIPVCFNSTPTIELQDTKGQITGWEVLNGATWDSEGVPSTPTQYVFGSALQSPVLVRVSAEQKALINGNLVNVPGCKTNVTDTVLVAIKNVWGGQDAVGVTKTVTDNEWNTAANWSFNTTPDNACSFVAISDLGATGTYPVLTANQTVQVPNLVLWDNAHIDLNDGSKLQVSGNIQQIGTNTTGYIDARKGTIEFNGTADQTIKSQFFKDTTIGNLVVSSQNKTLSVDNSGKSLAITGKISFGSVNGKLNSGDNITLKSTADGTASLGALGAGNTVSGKFTAERYINIGAVQGQHAKAWLFLATPTQGQSVKDSWMEGGNNASTGYGVNIPNTVGTGWDPGTVYAPSIKRYDYLTDTWVSKNNSGGNMNSTDPLFNPNGWMIFVRGDRSAKTINDPANNTNLRSKGNLLTGDQKITVPVKKDGFYSIGNPYASAVDITKVDGLGTTGTVYIWDPNLQQQGPFSIYGLGGYRTITYEENGYTVVPGDNETGVTYSDPSIIRSGQAFFVQTDADNPYDLVFEETSKADMSASGKENFRTAGMRGGKTSKLASTLYNTSDQVIDGTLQMFDSKYTNSVDRQDARKITNGGINLSLKVANKQLIVERRQPITKADTIFFNLTGTTNGSYYFKFDATNLLAPGSDAWLVDEYTKQRTPVSVDGETKVSFDVNNDVASKAVNRFSIVFRPAAPLPVTFVNVNAIYQGGQVNVKWAVGAESNLSKYVVMKSTDGNNFTDMADVPATGASDYEAIDMHAVNGYNYYRIRSVDRDGSMAYSEIVKVWAGSDKPSLRVFPNPVVNGVINLRFENMPSGKYLTRLLNPDGQLLLTHKFELSNNVRHNEKIPWNYKMAHGAYSLEVTLPDGSLRIIKVIY